MKINKFIFISLLIATLNASGMQDERKWNMKPHIFFNAQKIVNNSNMQLYRFQLLDRNPEEQKHPRHGEIASSLVSCEDNSCEMPILHVNRETARNRGYGSLLLQNVLSYLASNTNATEMGLLAKPMDSFTAAPRSSNFYDNIANFARLSQPLDPQKEQLRLNNFYKKNGGKNSSAQECAKDGYPESFCNNLFTFNLRK